MRWCRSGRLGLTRLALTAAACAPVAAAGADAQWISAQAQVELAPRVWQRVSVVQDSDRDSTAFVVRSIISNQSSRPYQAIMAGCQLEFAGRMQSTPHPDDTRCRGLPRLASLAPGDSLVVSRRRVGRPARGAYSLRVLHVYEPARWVTVTVRVR